MNFFIPVLIFFGNLWIWRIFQQDVFLGLLLCFCTLSLFLALYKKSRKYTILFFLSLSIILFFHWKNTERVFLTKLGNDEKRVQDMRLEEYPHYKITLGEKYYWIPLAHWFEGRKESIIFYKVKKNFSEVVDSNLYFFANHPRERVGIREFEKFPFVLMPFFIFGLFNVFKKNNALLLSSFILPIGLTAIIGSKSNLGVISVFPGFVVTISYGACLIYKSLRKKPKKTRFLISNIFVFAFFINFIQMIFYEKF